MTSKQNPADERREDQGANVAAEHQRESEEQETSGVEEKELAERGALYRADAGATRPTTKK